MRLVTVHAANLKPGDVIDGQRIREIHKYRARTRAKNPNPLAEVGVLLIVPNPDGYQLDAIRFRGDEPVKVRRPKYNTCGFSRKGT